jgi:hypothetical protein
LIAQMMKCSVTIPGAITPIFCARITRASTIESTTRMIFRKKHHLNANLRSIKENCKSGGKAALSISSGGGVPAA